MTDIGKGTVGIGFDQGQVGTALAGVGGIITAGLSKIGLAGGGALVAGVAAATVGLGTVLFSVGRGFDQLRDTIVVGTGASGVALESLMDSAKEVGKTTPSSFADIGVAIADLNTMLGLTGSDLETVAAQMLNVSRITGSDLSTNIEKVSRLFGDWDVATQDQALTLDKLFVASQETGINIDSLADKVVQFGSPLRQLGFDLDEAIALFGKWHVEGVNLESALPGFRQALKNFAKDGREPAEALRETITEIQNAKTEGEATSLAMETFGVRAGPDMAAAIREGRFEIDDLVSTLQGSEGAISDADERTRSFSERWQTFKNQVLIALEPLAIRFFDALSAGMKLVSDNANIVIPVLMGLGVVFGVLGVAALAAGVKMALAILLPMLPIALLVAAVALAVALIIIHWDTIKEWTLKIFNAIKDFFVQWWPFILGVFTGGLGLIVGLIIQNWDTIWSTTVSIWNSIVDFLAAIPGRVWGAIVAMVGFVKDIAAQAWSGFLNTMSSWVNAAIEWVKGIPGMIVDALGNLGGLLVEAGKAVLQGFWDGLKEKWDAVAGWVSGLKDRIVGLKGPLPADLGLLVPAGGAIMRGLQAGLEAEIPALERTMRDVTSVASTLTPAPQPTAAVPDVSLRAPTATESDVAINVHLHADGSREFLRWIRRTVRFEGGGDVQTALGQR